MPDDVKQAVDGLMTAFDEFKKTNDARLAEIEKKGVADPVTVEKLGKIEAKLVEFEGVNKAITLAADAASKANKEQLDRIELKAGRPGAGGDADKAAEKKAAYLNWCRKGQSIPAEEFKVLQASDDTAGGVLAPVEFVREIIKAEIEYSPMRELVRVRQTTMRSVQVPKRTGVFSARWVAELGARTETAGLAYGMEEIPTHELTAEVYVSMQELEDSAFNLESELNMEFSEQFGVAEGAALVSGDAVGKPQGFLSNANVGTTNSGAATTITADGLLSLFYGIKTAYSKNATWTLNRTTLGSARKLKDGNGVYLWAPGLASGVPNTINGAPYVETPDMPNEGAGTKPVAFGDWKRGYTLVDRLAIATLRDPYTLASAGQIKFVARRRLGGQVTLAEAIRTLTCSV